ncbi:MAG TPA: hypothetical protein VGI39_00580 [Polyangiaceae bacterium]|jgi:hypothetical protein
MAATSALLFATTAQAQDEAIPPQPIPPVATPPPPPPPPPTQSSIPGTFAKISDALTGSIERLPTTAYQDSPVRGIPGGSLAATFHGLQFPYYPKTGIGVSGYVWLDSGYEHISRGNPSEQGIKYLLQQGRMVLRVTPTWSNGSFFVQGQAEFVAEKDQSQAQPNTVDTDDVWIKFGQWNSWDVQVGRYEGWEVYHFGMGLDLYTLERNGAVDTVYSAPSIYGVTYAFYRPAGVGQAAAHFYPTKHLRFELGTQFGNETGSNTLAVRPVGVYDLGWVKLKAGAEFKELSDQGDNAKGWTKQRGFGGAIQFVAAPHIEFGGNAAYGLVDQISSTDGSVSQTGSYTTYSVGGFLNFRIAEDLVAGGGYDYTYLWDLHYDPSLNRTQRFRHTQTFLSMQYLIAKTLYVKVVGAYARADFAPTFGGPVVGNTNEMLSARIRLQYVF